MFFSVNTRITKQQLGVCKTKSENYTLIFAAQNFIGTFTWSGMPFSNPFTPPKNKHSSALYPPGFNNGSTIDLEWRSSHMNEMRNSTHDPIAQLDFGFSSSRRSSISQQSFDNVQQYPQGYYTSSSSENNTHTPSVPYSLATGPSRSTRYYSHALSDEDKLALAQGELNHNLQTWAPEDLVKHHESRKSLVPQGIGANKLRKIEAFAKIEEEKQRSQRASDKKVRGKAMLPSFRLTHGKGQQEYIAYHPQASQSMYDLRSASAPITLQPDLPPASPQAVPTLRRKYSWEPAPATTAPHQNVRTVGGTESDYFSFQRGHVVPPTPRSRTSSCVPSSGVPCLLSAKDTAHQHNPDTTFDTFLMPHISGKGEAYRGADNAKKFKVKVSDEDTGDTLRRFKKMRSTATLRQRFSRSGLRHENEKDDPDVPALP